LIYEYSFLAVFWALILVYVLLSRVYGIERKTQNFRTGGKQLPKSLARGQIKYRIYLVMLVVFLITYLISSIISALVMPQLLLRAGISAGYLLFSAIITVLAAVLSLFLLYFYRQWRYLKEAVQSSFRCTIFNLGRNITIAVLVIASGLYIMGLGQTFKLQQWATNRLPDFGGISPIIPLILLVTVILTYSGAFLIFIFRRSAFSLRQYWSFFILGFIALIVYAVMIPGQILDWNTSVLVRTQLLSAAYGYLGWIIILLSVLALYYTIGSAVFLRMQDLYNQSGKPKGIALLYLKIGYTCLMLTVAILIFPQVMDMF